MRLASALVLKHHLVHWWRNDMSVEQNKAIAHDFFTRAWGAGDLSTVEDTFAPNVYDHFDKAEGTEVVKQLILNFRTAFPDLKFTLEDEVAEGDKVVHRWSMSGTHQAPLMGIPATGKHASWTGITIVKFVDGKITDRWANVDILGVLQQLGVIPEQAPPAEA
jgi:steroid delta-isomerase-like uncharacterized protein